MHVKVFLVPWFFELYVSQKLEGRVKHCKRKKKLLKIWLGSVKYSILVGESFIICNSDLELLSWKENVYTYILSDDFVPFWFIFLFLFQMGIFHINPHYLTSIYRFQVVGGFFCGGFFGCVCVCCYMHIYLVSFLSMKARFLIIILKKISAYRLWSLVLV